MKTRAARGRKKRFLFTALVGLFLFYLMVSFFLGERGVLKDYRLRQERAKLRQEVAKLREENTRLSGEVKSLRTDPDYIERLAREQGLVKNGEIVYQYEEDR